MFKKIDWNKLIQTVTAVALAALLGLAAKYGIPIQLPADAVVVPALKVQGHKCPCDCGK